MIMLNCIIAIIVISFIISVLIGCNIYKVIKRKYDDEIGRVESKLMLLEERFMNLEDSYREHMAKYH